MPKKTQKVNTLGVAKQPTGIPAKKKIAKKHKQKSPKKNKVKNDQNTKKSRVKSEQDKDMIKATKPDGETKPKRHKKKDYSNFMRSIKDIKSKVNTHKDKVELSKIVKYDLNNIILVIIATFTQNGATLMKGRKETFDLDTCYFALRATVKDRDYCLRLYNAIQGDLAILDKENEMIKKIKQEALMEGDNKPTEDKEPNNDDHEDDETSSDESSSEEESKNDSSSSSSSDDSDTTGNPSKK
jgi:hypothetical protein